MDRDRDVARVRVQALGRKYATPRSTYGLAVGGCTISGYLNAA
jgi:hypothetical protein